MKSKTSSEAGIQKPFLPYQTLRAVPGGGWIGYWLIALVCGLFMVGGARAQFATSFETAQSTGTPTYTAGGTIVGVQDVSTPTGNKWTLLYGTSGSMTMTSSNPASGSLAFQINDASTTSAYAAYLNLAGTSGLDLTQPFTFSFAMNLSGISSGTGNQAQVYFGAPTTDTNNNKYWSFLIYNNGQLYIGVNSTTGNGSTSVLLGNYATYDTTGTNYVRVSISIDPVLKKYTRVTLSGSGVTTDCTAAVQAVNGGVIPWRSNVSPTVNPTANLLFVTGTDDTIKAKFDDVRITPSSQWFEAYAPGVILPDQGTIEMTLSLSRPIAQFGNSYDFLFKVLPAQKMINNGKTLMGVYVPPGGSGTGLWGIVRNGSTATSSVYVGASSFAPPAGQAIRVAMSWGSAVKLYLNGAQIATANSSIGNITPLPALFRIEQLDPYRVSEIKVSDVALATTSLSATASTPMQSDANTTMLAGGGLSRTQYFHSSRLTSLGYHSLTPQWRAEDQTLVYGMTPAYTLLGVNHSGVTKTYSVNIQATNRQGTIVLNTTSSVGIAADNTYHLTSLSLGALTGVNYYKLHTTITSPDSVVTTFDNAIAVYPANDTTVADGAWDKYLGHHYPIEDYSPVVLNRMGVKTNRAFGGFNWQCVQPNEGTGTNGFIWTLTDYIVDESRAAGIDLLAILGSPAPWSAQDPGATYKASYSSYSMMSGRWKPRSNTEWANYVTQVISRYKNTVKNWEIMNEADWHYMGDTSVPYYCFSGSRDEYLGFLQTAYAQAKATDTLSNVLMTGFSLVSIADTGMWSYLLNTMTSSTPFDTFASHGYDNTKVDTINTALYAKKGAGSPHWMTEQMWDSVSYEKDRLFLTPYLYLRYLDQGVDRFYQFNSDLSFDSLTMAPTIDGYVQGVFQTQMRKADGYVGKYTFTGSNDFGVRHYFTRKDGKTLSMLGQELTRNMVTVSGTVISAIDSFGKNITTTVSANATALDIADVAYIVSTSSLNITGVQLLEAAPLLLNTGYEDLNGDVQTGGLASCTPMYWTLRSTTYDAGGAIALTNSSVHAGTYAMSISSTGAGRVYIFQDTRIAKPGPYKITAWFRRPSATETAIPYVSIYNRDANATYTLTCSNVVAGGAYTQVTYTYTFSSALTQSAAIMGGVCTGSGTVLLDDMKFEYIGQ